MPASVERNAAGARTRRRGTAFVRGVATFLLLPALSVGLALAVFEVGLRVAGYRAIYEIYSKPWIFWEHDELLGWRHQPGASGRYVGPRPWPIEFQARVEINSLGLRGPELGAPEPDELRVLFLGDSMVAAFEVEHAQTFVALLGRELEARLARPVRTINAGVRGYGSDQSLLYLRERGWRLEPDLVVFFYSKNDLVDNTTLHEMRRPFGKPALALTDDGRLELLGVPVPLYPSCSEYLLSADFEVVRADTLLDRTLCRAQVALFDRSALFSLVTLAVPWNSNLLKRLYYVGNPHADQLSLVRESDPSFDYALELTMATLLEMAAESRRRGAAFTMLGVPRQLNALDRARLLAQDIEILDLSPLADVPREQLRWKHDAHFNPEGHRRLTRLLADPLEARLRDAAGMSAAGAATPAEFSQDPDAASIAGDGR